MPKKTGEFNRERETGVILEGLRSDFRVFGENLDTVKSDLKATKTMVGKNTEDITMINMRLAVMDSRLGNVENRLGNVENQLGTVKGDVTSIKAKINIVESDVTSIKVKLNGC